MPKSSNRPAALMVSDLVARLTDAVNQLVAERARTMMLAAFEGSVTVSVAAAPRARSQASHTQARRSSTKGKKRDPEVIAATAEKLAAHIATHPGQGIEAIAKALGTATKAFALPVRKLVGAKRITTRGQKRATTYFPGAARAAKPKTQRRAKRKTAPKPAKKVRPRVVAGVQSKKKSRPIVKAKPASTAPAGKPIEAAAAAS